MIWLTKKQIQTLNIVERWVVTMHRFPTTRELSREIGATSTNSAHCRLKCLQKKGYISDDRKPRLLFRANHEPFVYQPTSKETGDTTVEVKVYSMGPNR